VINLANIFTKEYEIHYYEVDIKKRLLMTSLIDFLGDIATDHSEKLGVGMDYLRENNMAWVLHNWDIDMYKYPVYGDKITIRTTPYAFKKFYGYRRFEIFNENGEVIGKAESLWILINTERKRPIRVPEYIGNIYGVEGEGEETFEFPGLQNPSRIDCEKEFKVRYTDIDTNMHVNNAKYPGWAIESVPMEVVLNKTLKNIKVIYGKETKYGDTIKVLSEIKEENNKTICLHKIEDKEGKELTQLETIWIS
jgi:medium-chain acyl-[acyl-carrier-protein] hydrolase